MPNISCKISDVIDDILEQLTPEELFSLARVGLYERIARFVDENSELFI